MKARMIKVAGLLLAGTLVFSTAYMDRGLTEAEAETIETDGTGSAGVAAAFEDEMQAYSGIDNGGRAGIAETFSQSLNSAEITAAQVSEMNAGKTASGQEEEETTTEETSAEETTTEETTICGYTNLGIASVDGNLNVREGAGTEYEVVGKMQNNAGCEILGVEGDWTKIQSGKVTGYVSSEFLVSGDDVVALADEVKQTIATVKEGTVTLFVREDATTDSEVVTMVPDGEELEVLEMLDGWARVAVDNDEGYVCTDYVEISTQLPKAQTLTELQYGQGVSDVRVDLVQYALQFVGNPYVWGGTSLTNGADCSGFVLSVFANYGISLPHHSGSQAGYGTKISSSEARPGDLFFYGNGSTINHVAIYIGNGQVVHASSPSSGIKISSAFYRTPLKVVNILGN